MSEQKDVMPLVKRELFEVGFMSGAGKQQSADFAVLQSREDMWQLLLDTIEDERLDEVNEKVYIEPAEPIYFQCIRGRPFTIRIY